ncbi:MAG: YHS domain-containing protein [Candidatus Latescibacteria bacterium]|nr:YHS domain-containing protein [Candidatus Latescibacterota bacterium]NIO29239.1 YHS domain-containing protein [Candidatus Latescibacterota bacterium]NIO56863.1 YHS domain-containing protein [Candidatus Latescibacterota bacterium]
MKRGDTKRDPVCGKRINRNKAHIVIEYKNQEYLVWCPICQSEFEKDLERYALKTRKR